MNLTGESVSKFGKENGLSSVAGHGKRNHIAFRFLSAPGPAHAFGFARFSRNAFAQPSFTTWRLRATARASAGTSAVMTAPVPT